MQEFVANAPIQTRQNSLNKHERLLAFLSAEALNRIREYQTGRPSPRVDVWNTVGSKSEKDWSLANSNQPVEYLAYHRQQIQSRYQILEEYYGVIQKGRFILTDSDEQYKLIVTENIRERIHSGDFFVRNTRFSHCPPCDYVIAPVEANIDKCPLCSQHELEEISTHGLFTTIDDDDRQQIINNTAIFPESARSSLKRHVLTMPDIIQLSKQRRFGISLTEFGIDAKFVLDPKIPLAMMGLVADKMQLGKLKTIVQGIDSVGNLAPYVYLSEPKSHYSYINIGLVPAFNGENINDRNKYFYRTFLPLIMMSLPSGIGVQERTGLFKEFDRTSKQFQFVLSQLSKNEASGDVAKPKVPSDEMFRLFNQYKIKEGVARMRQYIYEDLSLDYLDLCKNQGFQPDFSAIKQIEEMFSLIYK